MPRFFQTDPVLRDAEVTHDPHCLMQNPSSTALRSDHGYAVIMAVLLSFLWCGNVPAEEKTEVDLTGTPEELSNDDGTAAGKKSFPRGIASTFNTNNENARLTGVKIHGGRYGYPQAPKEDFVITVCDTDFKPLHEFKFPYSKFARGESQWVTLPVEPTLIPKDFVICLNFNPTRTKGVYVSHDADGKGLVGLPDRKAGAFTGGDWMVRALIDQPER